jgi:hypothetical protein
LHGIVENAYNTFVGKPEWNISLGRPRSRWESKVKLSLKEQDFRIWIRFMWLRKISIGGVLLTI